METLFNSDNEIGEYFRETQRGILSLRYLNPIYTYEEWHEKSRQIEALADSSQMVCDGGCYLRGNTDYDIGLLGLVTLRDELEYLFEFTLWGDPQDIESLDWDGYEDRLKWTWKLVNNHVDEPLPATTTIHNLSTVEGVINDIIDTYLDPAMEGIPWKMGVSWGKDSTYVVQLVVDALLRIPPEKRTRHIHLVTSDTCLELPPMINIMRKNLHDFEQFAKDNNLPITVHLVQPALPERFFTNLIGKGYTPPLGGPVKRWCTPRLKLAPSKRLDTELLEEKKKIIAVLGTRYDESEAREKSIKKREGQTRYGFTSTPGIFSYTPIVQLTTAQVWDGLKEGFYWGDNYAMLEELYRASSFNDTTAEQGRMGCSICFVVNRDKSLENLIRNGYEWLQPLKEYRRLVLEVVENRFYREPIPIDRRTALPTAKKATRSKTGIVIGGINQKGREYLLAQLLETQEKILEGMGKAGFSVTDGYELVTQEEIHWIKSWWNHLSGYSEPGFIPDEVVPKSPWEQVALF